MVKGVLSGKTVEEQQRLLRNRGVQRTLSKEIGDSFAETLRIYRIQQTTGITRQNEARLESLNTQLAEEVERLNTLAFLVQFVPTRMNIPLRDEDVERQRPLQSFEEARGINPLQRGDLLADAITKTRRLQVITSNAINDKLEIIQRPVLPPVPEFTVVNFRFYAYRESEEVAGGGTPDRMIEAISYFVSALPLKSSEQKERMFKKAEELILHYLGSINYDFLVRIYEERRGGMRSLDGEVFRKTVAGTAPGSERWQIKVGMRLTDEEEALEEFKVDDITSKYQYGLIIYTDSTGGLMGAEDFTEVAPDRDLSSRGVGSINYLKEFEEGIDAPTGVIKERISGG